MRQVWRSSTIHIGSRCRGSTGQIGRQAQSLFPPSFVRRRRRRPAQIRLSQVPTSIHLSRVSSERRGRIQQQLNFGRGRAMSGVAIEELVAKLRCCKSEHFDEVDHVRELDRKSTRLKLQSPDHLVCRLLLEKKKKQTLLPHKA